MRRVPNGKRSRHSTGAAVRDFRSDGDLSFLVDATHCWSSASAWLNSAPSSHLIRQLLTNAKPGAEPGFVLLIDKTKKVSSEYIALPANLVITSRSTHHRRRSAMKSLVTPALVALVSSAAAAKILSRHDQQPLPEYAPGTKLIQEPDAVIEESRIISVFERSAVNGEDCCDNY
jgi:hypothetical protein